MIHRYPVPRRSTKLIPSSADAVVEELWVDEVSPPHGPVLWLRARDGDLVAVPRSRWGALKKIIRRLK